MSAIREQIADVVAPLASALKAAGFRKNGLNFRREVSPGVIRLVDVQCSQWNRGNEGSFTINLGVYHRALAELHDTSPVVDVPLVKHCVVRERIGKLMPEAEDHWWTANKATDLAELGIDVA